MSNRKQIKKQPAQAQTLARKRNAHLAPKTDQPASRPAIPVQQFIEQMHANPHFRAVMQDLAQK